MSKHTRKVRKIQLISAPLPTKMEGVGNTSCFPPTGLLSLATYLRRFKDIEVEILDGGLVGMENILANVDADLVGVSSLGPTYECALGILRLAKDNGAITVLGGHHTYHLYREILNNREFIDFIVRGDSAELGFLGLARFLDGDIDSRYDVCSLVFRDNGELVANPTNQLIFEDLPVIDLSLIDMQPYFDNYNKYFGKWHNERKIKNAVTRNAQGCSRGAIGRCIYCNIPDMSFRYRSPERFWRELLLLDDLYGINFVFETADSLASFSKVPHSLSNYLECLARTRPGELDTDLFVFARAEEITMQTIRLFQDIGVVRVNMGLDSGDGQMLRTGIAKGNTSLETNRRAVHLLHEAGIQMYVSFVLGGIGETEESLQNTIEFAKELLSYDHIIVLDPSPLLPLPGSPAWDLIHQRFLGMDLIDTEEAARYWAELKCKTDFESIKAANNQIRQMALEKGLVVGGYGIKNV